MPGGRWILPATVGDRCRGLLHLAPAGPAATRVAASAVTLAPASLLPAAAAEVVLVAGRRWAAAAVGAVVLAGCAATHVRHYRRDPRPLSAGCRADVELTVMAANLLHGKADPTPWPGPSTGSTSTCCASRRCTRPPSTRSPTGSPRRSAAPAEPCRAPRAPGRHLQPLSVGRTRGAPEGYGFPPVMADVGVPITRAPGTRSITVLSFHSKAPLGNGGTRHWSDDLARVGRLMREHPAR